MSQSWDAWREVDYEAECESATEAEEEQKLLKLFGYKAKSTDKLPATRYIEPGRLGRLGKGIVVDTVEL